MPFVFSPQTDCNGSVNCPVCCRTDCFADPEAVDIGSAAREDDELLGSPSHRDVAVDGSFDACSDRVRVDKDDEVELEALRVFGGQPTDPRRCRDRAILTAMPADDAGDAFAVCGQPRVEDGTQVGHLAVW